MERVQSPSFWASSALTAAGSSAAQLVNVGSSNAGTTGETRPKNTDSTCVSARPRIKSMLLVDKLPESPDEYWRFDDSFAYFVSRIHKPKSLLVEPPEIVWERPRDPFTVYVIKCGFIHPETKEFGWVVMPSEDFLVEEVRKEILLFDAFRRACEKIDWSSFIRGDKPYVYSKPRKDPFEKVLDLHFDQPFFGVTK